MLVYAHRGASGTFPENTIAAFKEAARLPVHGVEFDVHLTKDGELVVIHDETIDRTSNGSGYVKDLTLAQLKEYDFGSWFSPDFAGEKIPTLEEVLHLFQSTHHHINIELKSDIFPYEGMTEKVLELIKAHNLESRVVLSSFDHSAIQEAKRIAPYIETGVLTMEVLVQPLEYLKNIPADAYHLLFPTAIRPSYREVYEAGIPVRAYTVNEENYASLLQQAGVQAIFTDYPERLYAFLKA
ncbi:glycerophosphoryl diester phosphodiesterase [Sporosarcina sp. NCCP-2222]|uniref:glycerophosphodiester phosphodiesterase n=1 Tax=Sporosarcina sp. NCCP-2222 TaxID=2935073 RepID=UPI002083C6A7|nr:glycerophosphodiester phosphodiesterase [Sporosarcina sp. NCCP-2222]GKV54742.1 glycerophosphoryl diester phosphodiesterase [Sporosarcina sp. NCCP-2222]